MGKEYQEGKYLQIRDRENDDVIQQALNLFATMLNNECYGYGELDETKNIVESAMEQYDVLKRSLHLNSVHNINTKKKYLDLINRDKDNLEA